MATKIEIPKQLWYIKREEETLAYLTAYGTDASSIRRQGTGLSWARGYGVQEKTNDPVIVDNELCGGFKIIDNVSRWSTSNVVWRVLDPRGFECEIYSGNMMEIVKCARIENGVIQTKCIWGRESGKNVLLPESSVPYLEAVKYTNNITNCNITMKDVKPGDIVTLKSNKKYVYMGSYISVMTTGTTDDVSHWLTSAKDKLHYFKSCLPDGRIGSLSTFSSPKPIAIEGRVEYVDYKEETLKCIQEEGGLYTRDWRTRVIAVVNEIPSVLEYRKRNIPIKDLTSDEYRSYSRSRRAPIVINNEMVFCDVNGGWGVSPVKLRSCVLNSFTPNQITYQYSMSTDWKRQQSKRPNMKEILQSDVVSMEEIYVQLNDKEILIQYL